MAQPGKFSVKGTGLHRLIYEGGKSNPRWYRIFNAGANTLGVTYTDADGLQGRSLTIEAGMSLDLAASKIELRDDTGGGVSGTYEALP